MKLLIDTNVVLDVLLRRESFYEESSKVLKLSSNKNIQEYVSASAITDIYYIAYRQLRDKKAVKELLQQLLQVIGIAAVSQDEIHKALEMKWNDFEDSVQYAVALSCNVDIIVSRNISDFQEKEIQVLTPTKLMEVIEQTDL